jgi:pyruvate kinase
MVMKNPSPPALWYTVGPASLGKEEDLFRNGATGIRLTFNFGTPELQHERAVNIKAAAAQVGSECFVVADLGGEKFRIGTFVGDPTVTASAGALVRLVHAETGAPSSDDLTLPIPNSKFLSQLKKGSIVTVGDGSAVFVVTKKSDRDVLAEMTSEGVINNCRGLTIQGEEFQPKSLTSKDLTDLDHILSSPVYDAVALSFVGSDTDVSTARQLANKAKRDIPIVAKIETAAGVANIDSICKVSDFVMVARGDLAVAIPWLDLPSAVKEISLTAKSKSIPWILATQIAEGLERFTMPTRAEICDLARWMEDGCAGILLSYETAFGAKPIAAVTCTAALMNRWSRNA